MERDISTLISGRKLYEFARHLPVSWVGRIVAIAPGCKPGDFGLRRFESCPAHEIRSHVSYVVGCCTVQARQWGGEARFDSGLCGTR